jgi:hypothetical protein
MNKNDMRYVRDTLKELWSVMKDWIPQDEVDSLEDDYNECMELLEEQL